MFIHVCSFMYVLTIWFIRMFQTIRIIRSIHIIRITWVILILMIDDDSCDSEMLVVMLILMILMHCSVAMNLSTATSFCSKRSARHGEKYSEAVSQ